MRTGSPHHRRGREAERNERDHDHQHDQRDDQTRDERKAEARCVCEPGDGLDPQP
jgi:hypothetical protein